LEAGASETVGVVSVGPVEVVVAEVPPPQPWVRIAMTEDAATEQRKRQESFMGPLEL
jgi:hypothetical protein